MSQHLQLLQMRGIKDNFGDPNDGVLCLMHDQSTDGAATMSTESGYDNNHVRIHINYNNRSIKIPDNLYGRDASYVLYDFNKDGIKDFLIYSMLTKTIKIYDLTKVNENNQATLLRSIKLHKFIYDFRNRFSFNNKRRQKNFKLYKGRRYYC